MLPRKSHPSVNGHHGSLVGRRIEALGLRVSLDKTEPLLFHGSRRGPPSRSLYRCKLGPRTSSGPDDVSGPDPRRKVLFDKHFELASKLVNAASALGDFCPIWVEPALKEDGCTHPPSSIYQGILHNFYITTEQPRKSFRLSYNGSLFY